MTQSMIFGLATEGINWSEPATKAGIVGLAVIVFIAFAILWVRIKQMDSMIGGDSQESSDEAEGSPVPVAGQGNSASKTFGASDESEVVAAIIAAITAMREEEGQHGGFRVVSFKRVGPRFGKNKFN